MIDNRQGGRRRGRGGQRPQGNPGRPGGNNRIDNRARGNAQQLHEKYKNLARDAQMAGDRVNTEYYLQFADHYFRVLNENRARFEEQRPRRDDGEDGYDSDEGDEFETQGNRDQRDNGQRRDNQAGGRDRDRQFRRDDEQPRRERQSEQAESGEDATPVRANDVDQDQDQDQARTRRPRRRREESEGATGTLDAAILPPAIAAGNDTGDEEPAAPRRRGRRPRAESANDTAEVPPAA